jgi:hypothetical protein
MMYQARRLRRWSNDLEPQMRKSKNVGRITQMLGKGDK